MNDVFFIAIQHYAQKVLGGVAGISDHAWTVEEIAGLVP